MAKKDKEKKSMANAAAVAPSLVDDERALEVSLVDFAETEAMLDLALLLRVNNEPRIIALRDVVKEARASSAAAAAAVADGVTGPSPSLPPLLPLSRQIVQVSDAAVRDTLLNRREANRVDVYAVPSAAAAGGEGGNGRRPSRGGDKKAKGAAAAGGKGKGQASGGSQVVPPEGARCVGGAALSLVPLLSSTTFDISIPLTGCGAFAAALCLRVCCRDAPLLTASGMLQCRPVVLRIGGLQGVPAMSTPKDDDAAFATAASPRVLRARVELGGATVTTPALSVMGTPAPVARPRSPAAEVKDAPVDYCEHVLFLDALGSPLEVYRQLYATACRVSLWQSFRTSSDDGGAGASSPVKSGAKQGKSETLLGSGAFSVRDYLSDDQLRFSESVQLLPDRSTVSLAGGQTCLTASSTLKVSVNFFHAFPAVQHVDHTGALLTHKAFLTRAILRVPFQTPWMREWLTLLLREVTALPRATEDVRVYVPPPPSPSLESQDGLERTTTAGSRAGTAGSAKPSVASPPAAARLSKKGTAAKADGAKAAAAAAASAVVPEAVAAPPRQGFDVPLRLISPPGLSGFELTDGAERLWCVEGTVPEVHHVLTRVTAFLEAHGYANTSAALLFNAELFVPSRAYLSFPALVTPPASLAKPTTAAGAALGVGGPAGGALALEVEPSGTGGRFHRIRLRTRLETLRQTQGHYVRHTLSNECLDCLTCLTALLRARSMREAETRGCLPSAALLIALERSFGQTLEKEDLYGATPPTSPTAATAVVGTGGSSNSGRNSTLNVAATANAAALVRTGGVFDEKARHSVSTSSAALVDGVPPGTLVSFDGVMKTTGARRPIPSAVRQRFPVMAWMMVSETGEEVLCAFAHSAPTGLVQYHVEGQVVNAAAVTLLYVLQCVCLARSFTHSHNADYERVLRERQRAQHSHLAGKAVLWPSTAATRNAAGLPVATERAESDALRTAARHSSRRGKSHLSAPSGGPSRRGTGRSSDDDDDCADGDDWLESNFYDHLEAPASRSTAVKPSATGTAAVSTLTKSHSVEHLKQQQQQHGSKERLGVPDTAAAEKSISNEELWRMYEQRAPATTTTTTTAASTATSGEKLPPIRL